MACSPRGCSCALSGPAVQSGSGEVGDPYIIETGIPDIVTSLTRPASPFDGQLIWETDTSRMYMWRSSAWRIVRDPSPFVTRFFNTVSNVDSPTAGTATLWAGVVLSDVVVPPWATRGRLHMYMAGVVLSGGDAQYRIVPRLEGVAAANTGIGNVHGLNGFRFGPVAMSDFTGLTPGATLTPEIWTIRDGGTGLLRLDAFSRVTVEIDWSES